MKKPILFVHLPRVAGTFVSNYAEEIESLTYYIYDGKAHEPASTIENPEKYFKFGLIRNPFDWYVSQYCYFIDKPRKRRHKGSSWWKVKVPEQSVSKDTDDGLFGKDFLKRFPTLKSWVKFGVESKLPNFWLTDVYDYMFGKDGKDVDHVGKMEEVYREFDWVFKTNETTPEKRLKNFYGYRNESRRSNYCNYYDEDTIEIILEKDKRLFKKYDYKYEYE